MKATHHRHYPLAAAATSRLHSDIVTPVTGLTFRCGTPVPVSPFFHGGETILSTAVSPGMKTLGAHWKTFGRPSSIARGPDPAAGPRGYLPRLVAKASTARFCPRHRRLCRLCCPTRAESRKRRSSATPPPAPGQPRPLYDSPANRLTQLTSVYRGRSSREPRYYRVRAGGHLLGSAFVIVRLAGGKTILFGGDLGRYGRPVLPDPVDPVSADLVLVESTYGDRDHPADDDGESLARVIRDTAARGGKVIVPAFAIGRVEELLYWISRLERARRIPVLPVYVDSPMATDALKFYASRISELDPEIRPTTKHVTAFGPRRDSDDVVATAVEGAHRQQAQRGRDSAAAWPGRPRPIHMAAALPDPRNTALFVGFQAEGTRGRQLIEGAPDVKIHGRVIPVRARIEKVNSMSAHADRSEILRWLKAMPAPPARLCLVHGEPGPMDALKALVRDRLGWDAHTPGHGETVTV